MNCVLEDASVFSGAQTIILERLEELAEHRASTGERRFNIIGGSSVQANRMIGEILSSTCK